MTDLILPVAAILFIVLVAVPVWRKQVKRESGEVREMFAKFDKERR